MKFVTIAIEFSLSTWTWRVIKSSQASSLHRFSNWFKFWFGMKRNGKGISWQNSYYFLFSFLFF